MKSPSTRLALACALACASLAHAQSQTAPQAAPQVTPAPQYPALPSETPAEFAAPAAGFNYVKRSVMIPMRDGTRLNTIVIVPKGATNGGNKAPILLTRTPYDAASLISHAESSDLESILTGYDNAADVIVQGGYIRVVQDVRGKYGSEGDYVMNRSTIRPTRTTPSTGWSRTSPRPTAGSASSAFPTTVSCP
jgi:predicted acyl esterase